MKFLIDAHLPRRLVYRLNEAGHEAIHTLDLPRGNRTTDSEIIAVSEREQRIVVTKDIEFVDALILTRRPYKLLLISTGNISNRDLEALLVPNISAICEAFAISDFVELDQFSYIVHF